MTKDVEKNEASVKPAVDWTRPIEAVHEDGRVVAAKYDRLLIDQSGHKIVYDDGEGPWSWCVTHDGATMVDKSWHIRNVAQPTTRTAAEQLDRIEALCRKIANDMDVSYKLSEIEDEARAIVAELPAVVDPDQEEAIRLATQIKCGGPSVALALAAIKRGRALALEGK